MSRLAITQALEALEAGDTRLVADILLTALDEFDDGPAVRRSRCPYCRLRFESPGLLDQHVQLVHDVDEAAA